MLVINKTNLINRFFEVLIFLLFCLNTVGNVLILPVFVLFVSTVIIYVTRIKITIPIGVLFLGFVMVFSILYGYGNEAWLIDSRYNITWFLVLVVFFYLFKTGNIKKFVKTLYVINIGIFIIYLLLSLGIYVPIFSAAQAEIPAYMSYRTAGPPLFYIYILPFIYLIFGLEKDRVLLYNGILGAAAILINGSGQNFAIFSGLYLLCYLEFGQNSKTVRNTIIFLILVVGVGIYIGNKADSRLTDKISSIISPLETATVQTRVRDVTYALEQPRSDLQYAIGKGIGTRTSVFRYNPLNPDQNSYRTFLEVDNGFYYVFNRFGLLGLAIFLLSHLYFLRRTKGLRPKIAFLVILFGVNLISIHYWTHAIGALVIAIIMAKSSRLQIETLKKDIYL